MMLARLHHGLGQPGRAMEALEAHVRQHALSTDLTHINILAELYMEAGRHSETLVLIQRSEGDLCAAGGLPIDLTVRACTPRAEENYSQLHAPPWTPFLASMKEEGPCPPW